MRGSAEFALGTVIDEPVRRRDSSGTSFVTSLFAAFSLLFSRLILFIDEKLITLFRRTWLTFLDAINL